MASGTISLGTNGKLQGRIVWSSVAGTSSQNYSTVTGTIQAARTDSYGPTYGTWTGNLNINGTNQTFSTYASINASWVTLLSFSVTVNHNDNGTGTCTISGKVTGPTGTSMSGKSVSGSQTVTLDTIPRYPTANQSLNNKTETTIIMNWSSDSTIDYAWYSTNNGSSWTGVDVSDGKSGTYTISGLSANTAYNIKTRLRRKDSQLTKDTGALSVTTYNFPYATTMPNFTIGNAVTVNLYNPLGRNCTVTMIGADNSTIYSGNGWTGTSVGNFATTGIINNLYASIPSAKNGTYKIRVQYSSSSITKTGGTYTINTSACTPSITNVAYQDTNTTTINITGNNQQIIRNQSTVRYSASGLTVKNSATISSCKVTVNGNTYNLSVSGTGATGGNAVIDSASNITATFTLTDSRGLTATKSVTVTMLDWVLPTAIITLQRKDNYYTETNINVDALYSSVANHNTISIGYAYKKTTSSSYSSYVTLQDNVTATANFDNNYDWNIRIRLTDIFGTTYYNLILPKGLPIIYFDRIKSSTGFNCFPADNQSVEILGENIYNALYYSSGNTLTLNGLTVCGMLSSGSQEINFSIITSKSMKNVTPIITELRSNIRISSGGYLFGNYISGGYNILNDSNLTTVISKINDYMLKVVITKSTAWSTTNNTPLAVTLDNAVVSFS